MRKGVGVGEKDNGKESSNGASRRQNIDILRLRMLSNTKFIRYQIHFECA